MDSKSLNFPHLNEGKDLSKASLSPLKPNLETEQSSVAIFLFWFENNAQIRLLTTHYMH